MDFGVHSGTVVQNCHYSEGNLEECACATSDVRSCFGCVIAEVVLVTLLKVTGIALVADHIAFDKSEGK
jgi:hypothetical protein